MIDPKPMNPCRPLVPIWTIIRVRSSGPHLGSNSVTHRKACKLQHRPRCKPLIFRMIISKTMLWFPTSEALAFRQPTHFPLGARVHHTLALIQPSGTRCCKAIVNPLLLTNSCSCVLCSTFKNPDLQNQTLQTFHGAIHAIPKQTLN